MKGSVSLWSADLLNLSDAVARLEAVADGFHLDMMDGNCVPNLLFGPDFVSALKLRTKVPLDVHLYITRTDEWISRFVESGADMLTVHRRFCLNVGDTLARIKSLGAKAGLAIELNEEIHPGSLHFGQVDRILLAGTEIGIKGCDIHPSIFDRVRQLARLRDSADHSFEIYVDGGIRRDVVPRLAEAGADGVIPGSLVFGADNPVQAMEWIHHLQRGRTNAYEKRAATS